MCSRLSIALLVTLGACRGSPAAAPAAAPMPGRSAAPPAADRASVERIERALADDSMEGRGTGTRGGERAARYLAGQMARIGLKPGGDSAYFQFVPVAGPASGAGRLTVLKSIAAWDSLPAARRRRAVNVIGILPGTDPALAHETIIVLSHYDHLGIGRPENGDSIYNGADDDASGTTAVLEVARHLRQHPTRRTIVFANMTGEELGLLGTNWYLSHPRYPLTDVAAGFEIEMIGRPDSLAGGPGKAWLTGYNRSTMGDILTQFGIPIVPDPRPCERFFTRSDNYGFAERGVVAHTLSSFNLHADYHHVGDDVSKIDFDHMTRVIAAATEAVRHLADGPKPQWHAGMDPKSMPERPPADCPARRR